MCVSIENDARERGPWLSVYVQTNVLLAAAPETCSRHSLNDSDILMQVQDSLLLKHGPSVYLCKPHLIMLWPGNTCSD